MSSYDKVLKAREQGRATSVDYINALTTDFLEMHGDRRFGDDKAIVAGVARFEGMPVTVVGIEKGKKTKDKVEHNFGSAHPEGYRKALRQMKQAEKFGRPVLCFVDTAGAYCGIGAEERGQGLAIAENIMTMMDLKVPIVTVIIGEGGSGGALALAVADRVWMMENAVYSVISPEGCASILWKDSTRVREASECLKMTADDLVSLGVVDEIIPESGADWSDTFVGLGRRLSETLASLTAQPVEERTTARHAKYRAMGL